MKKPRAPLAEHRGFCYSLWERVALEGLGLGRKDGLAQCRDLLGGVRDPYEVHAQKRGDAPHDIGMRLQVFSATF